MDSKTRITSDGRLCFWCPGCKEAHAVTIGDGGRWHWNGDRERATLSPSVLVTSGHFVAGHSGVCWCTYNAEHPNDPAPFACGVCHSFVTDGKIIFLADCSHEYAGKTVELEPFLAAVHQ